MKTTYLILLILSLFVNVKLLTKSEPKKESPEYYFDEGFRQCYSQLIEKNYYQDSIYDYEDELKDVKIKNRDFLDLFFKY